MLDKKTYKDTFSALHASGDTLKEVYDMIEKRRRGSLGRSFLAVAAVVALMLALCAVAYAADWFGFRALLRPGTTEFEGQTYNNISLTQPQAVPPGLDSSIAEKVENSKAAWAEFSAWRVEHDPMKDLPEVFQNVLGMGITDLEDGGAELTCNTEDGLETRYATLEEYAEFRALMDELNSYDGEYAQGYGVSWAGEEQALRDIAAKYGLDLLGGFRVLWSSETTGLTGEGFYTNAELAEMTAEFGNSGSVFYEPPAGFDKVYYYDEGSFGLKFYLEAPSGAGQLSCYGYNSVYSTLSSGGVMSWEADLSSFTERRHTAPDGTELTILSNGSDAYIYVYLEDSFFAMHVYGAEDMSDADVDYAADAINYSNIGR